MTATKQNRVLWVVVTMLAVVVVLQAWSVYRLQRALASRDDLVSPRSSLAQSTPPVVEKPKPQRPPRPDIGMPQLDDWLLSPLDRDKWDPFAELERLQRHIDSMFRDMFNRWRTIPGWEERWEIRLPSFSPQIDIREERDRYIITADIPGVDKSDIKVELNDRTLTISGRRRSEKRASGKHFLRMEREYGEFSRQIVLPGPVDPEGMTASYTNGVLTIIIPKATGPSLKRNVPVV